MPDQHGDDQAGRCPYDPCALRSLRPAQEPEDSERGGVAGEQGLLFRGGGVVTLGSFPAVFAVCWLPFLI